MFIFKVVSCLFFYLFGFVHLSDEQNHLYIYELSVTLQYLYHINIKLVSEL